MNYLSLFSGIEAASVAWEPLGWQAVAFSEIEPFCCELLADRYPTVPNLGDISGVDWSNYEGSADVIIGGSPCQAFSVAGNRRGLMDERGLLMLEFVRSVREVRPRWVIWENVPGVLSQDSGRAFGTLLRELEDCGYALAWRVLDAQFFGVPQRRRRVFLIGHPIAGCAAGVLFEPHCMRGDNPTSREKRQELAADTGAGITYPIAGNIIGRDDINGGHQLGVGKPSDPMFTLDTWGNHALAFIWNASFDPAIGVEVSPTIRAAHSGEPAVFQASNGEDFVGTLCARDFKGVGTQYVEEGKLITNGAIVRRLTPVECERLQGFPDNWTDLGGTADAVRYKALGNSMAVPVIRWLGMRIQAIDNLT